MQDLKSIALAAMLTSVCAGCASTHPETFYTLTSIHAEDLPADIDSKDKAITISLGPISFPDFLDRPQVVTRTGKNTLNIADFHRWGGSLQNDFYRVLGENLSVLLGTNHIFPYRQQQPFPIDYNITLDIKRFDGSLGDKMILRADWILTNQEDIKTAVAKRSIIGTATDSNDYGGLISAQSEAILVLGREIAETIRALTMDKPPR